MCGITVKLSLENVWSAGISYVEILIEIENGRKPIPDAVIVVSNVVLSSPDVRSRAVTMSMPEMAKKSVLLVDNVPVNVLPSDIVTTAEVIKVPAAALSTRVTAVGDRWIAVGCGIPSVDAAPESHVPPALTDVVPHGFGGGGGG